MNDEQPCDYHHAHNGHFWRTDRDDANTSCWCPGRGPNHTE